MRNRLRGLGGEAGATILEYGVISMAVLTVVAVAVAAWGQALAAWFARMVDVVNGYAR